METKAAGEVLAAKQALTNPALGLRAWIDGYFIVSQAMSPFFTWEILP
jgi:hypothetical protein